MTALMRIRSWPMEPVSPNPDWIINLELRKTGTETRLILWKAARDSFPAPLLHFSGDLLRIHFILHPSSFILHPFRLMLLDGDPQWQRYLFYAATAFLIWEIWRGWRLGAIRGLLRLAALFCRLDHGNDDGGSHGHDHCLFLQGSPSSRSRRGGCHRRYRRVCGDLADLGTPVQDHPRPLGRGPLGIRSRGSGLWDPLRAASALGRHHDDPGTRGPRGIPLGAGAARGAYRQSGTDRPSW